MKKTITALLVGLFAMFVFMQTSFAIYTGEEQEPPKEGEMQIMKALDAPVNEDTSVSSYEAKDVVNEQGEVVGQTRTLLPDEAEVLNKNATKAEESNIVEEVVPISARIEGEEKSNTLLYVGGIIVLVLGLAVLLFKRKK